MEFIPSMGGRTLFAGALAGLLLGTAPSLALADAANPVANEIRIVELQGKVEISPAGARTWVLTQTNQVLHASDHLRTGPNSRAAIILSGSSGQSVVRFGALTEVEILAAQPTEHAGLQLIRGLLSFFHRDNPGRIRVITRGAVAGVEGTEFVMEVEPATDRTTLSVIEGRVRLANPQGTLVLTDGEQAIATPGNAPQRAPGFIANNLLQWCFYYPAILDLHDLPLTSEQQTMLGDSLSAYQTGDLLAALARYPEGGQPASDAERIYYAALLLSVGQVEQTEAMLKKISSSNPTNRLFRLANSLHQMIAAVKGPPASSTFTPLLQNRAQLLATELLADSYYQQSLARRETSLTNALSLAQQAAATSPEFGFAWARVAELEFSFGQTSRALDALNKSLALSPRNAQALALKGFLLAAQNKIIEAIGWFDQAIAMDSALGNAWLGRGLCRIRRGDMRGGREDLLIAAALEPQRATLRSYLGKAYANQGDYSRATKEIQLATKIDPDDPTSWLYSALNNEQQNRINDAIRDLERSQELTDNRRIYRSEFLLDQDRAVRSANLARIYQDAGMPDVAFREAARAVNSDYANYSAHLFLANSYHQLRDPNLVNLRFEPAETSEYLLANLLAPVGAGILSPTISQQEYSKLFQRDRLGFISATEYLSRGSWVQQGSQFGTFGNSSYSLEAFYRTDPGQRPNNDFAEMNLSLLLKQQLTPQDSVFAQVGWFNSRGGDLAQRYSPRTASPDFRSREAQEPSLSLGYHHEWQPGVHTLLLAGRLPDRFSLVDSNSQTLAFDPFAKLASPISLIEDYHANLTAYFVELQQLIQIAPGHDTIVGVRYSHGSLQVKSDQIVSFNQPPNFPDPGQSASLQDFSSGMERMGIYAYHRWEIIDHLWLQGGVSYDWIKLPENFLFAPLSSGTLTKDQLSPKAGLVWSPLKDTTIRVAYTRSLAGASLEQSLRLEPAQVAGFTQAYRDVVPESAVGGPTPGAPFETVGVALEQKFESGIYFGLSGELINSEFNRIIGGYYLDFDPATFTYSLRGPASAHQHLDYTEKSLLLNANQLIGRDWSLGVRYRVTESHLAQRLNTVQGPFLPLVNPPVIRDSVLHQVSLDANWNHPSGIFARFGAHWNRQGNSGYSPDEPGDNFWQFNAFGGYRFPRRHAEITFGVLNLADRDYRLEPLTFHNDLPRRRTFLVRALFNF